MSDSDPVNELRRTSNAFKNGYETAQYTIEAAALLRGFLKAANLSPSGVARRMGISPARIAKVLKGEGRDGPTYGFIKRFAVACGIDWPGVLPAAGEAARHSAALPEVQHGTRGHASRLARIVERHRKITEASDGVPDAEAAFEGLRPLGAAIRRDSASRVAYEHLIDEARALGIDDPERQLFVIATSEAG